MIDQLIAQRFLRRSGEYLTLSVTDEGMKILSGQVNPKLTRILEKEKKAAIKKKQKLTLESDYANMELGLFESLKTLRRALADRKHMPAYIVCSDRTLKELAEKKPKTEAELRTIFGIGEAKLRDYGEIFLNAVKEYEKK
jgi:ATP-dependent DNA helicase RecQ